jgi:hypothetical protein
MAIAQYTPERIADRFMIQDLMYRWCRAVDRLDRQGMLDIFWPGAIDSHGPYIGPAEGLVDWILTRHKPIKISSHFVGNMLIEFATPDLALTETSFAPSSSTHPMASSPCNNSQAEQSATPTAPWTCSRPRATWTTWNGAMASGASPAGT